jgi:hypothetical protein
MVRVADGMPAVMSDSTSSESSSKGAPILFVLGPSGVGKSQLGTWIAEDLKYLHLEIDYYPDGDGIGIAGLRSVWDDYYARRQVRDFAAAVQRKIVNREGAVLTFPRNLVLSQEHIVEGQAFGITTVILSGPKADSLDAFLKREQQLDRGLDKAHWERYNEDTYPLFGIPELAPYRENAFISHARRGRESLVEAVRRHLAR